MYKFYPKKRLGQNFLKNQDLLRKISELKNFENKSILEIGPGKGALTEYLLKKKPKKLLVIEKDEELKPFLINIQKKYPKILEIIFQDVLTFEYSKIKDKKIFLVANLPYYLATTLVIQWLRYIKGDKKMKYPIWVYEIVSKHLQCSMREANDAVEMYRISAGGQSELADIMFKYGVEDKEVRKLGLI